MLNQKFKEYNIILASKSPRRKDLLSELNIDFKLISLKHIEEKYPDNINNEEIAVFLAKLKADAFINNLSNKDIVITADTIVLLNDNVMNKPKDKNDAIEMLTNISGNKHRVITGVCITSKEKRVSFSAKTDVYFRKLTNKEITYYVDKYKPYDKAGAYGIQEWIGYIGVEKIEGSYFNVMGLPVQKLYDELMLF